MTAEQEEELMQRVMEESVNDHDEAQWHDLEVMTALSAAGDVAIPPELEEAFVVKEEVVVMEEEEAAVVKPNFMSMVG